MTKSIVSVVVALASATIVASQPCPETRGTRLVGGRDDTGFFIRGVKSPQGHGSEVGPNAIIVAAAESLASEGRALAFFASAKTSKAVPLKEWRDPTPLGALRAFCADAGLEVVEVPPNWWVIGRPEYQRVADFTVSIHPADPQDSRQSPEAERQELEDVLVGQLPVRNSLETFGLVAIELSYRFSTDAPTTTAVVVEDRLNERFSTKYVRKVSVTRTEAGYKLDCLWKQAEVYGPLVSEINEDFDGDGVRDPVFLGGPCGRAECDAVILSGATGERLFEFGGNELAVEKSPTGPPRIAAEWSFSVDRGKYLSPRDRAEVRGDRRHLVARFDPATRACLVDVRAGERAKEHAKASRPGYDRLRTRDALASIVGGLEKVRVYVFGPAHYDPASTSEQIKIERIFWQLDPPDALGFRHPVYQSRLVFRYRAPEVIEKENQEKMEKMEKGSQASLE